MYLRVTGGRAWISGAEDRCLAAGNKPKAAVLRIRACAAQPVGSAVNMQDVPASPSEAKVKLYAATEGASLVSGSGYAVRGRVD